MSATFGANPAPMPAADVAYRGELALRAAQVFQPCCVGARALPFEDEDAKL
jgi:hypothetical protein